MNMIPMVVQRLVVGLQTDEVSIQPETCTICIYYHIENVTFTTFVGRSAGGCAGCDFTAYGKVHAKTKIKYVMHVK